MRLRPEWLPKDYFLSEVDDDQVFLYRENGRVEEVGVFSQAGASPQVILEAIREYEMEPALA